MASAWILYLAVARMAFRRQLAYRTANLAGLVTNAFFGYLRAAVFVDRFTSAITVVSDPLPTMKDGIPFQVKTVNVNINRPQFTFNATNCKPMAIGATISSTQGAQASVSSPYQAVNCATLPFAPAAYSNTLEAPVLLEVAT